jgi:hypothetical protein
MKNSLNKLSTVPRIAPRCSVSPRLFALAALQCALSLFSLAAAPVAEEINVKLEPCTPWVRHAIDDTSSGADGVKFGDANGDGLIDIASGWEEGSAVRLYLNPGPAKSKYPWSKVTVGNVARSEDAIIVDLDGDGRMEVVSATEGNDRTMYVHWAQTADALDRWKTEAFPCTQDQQSWMFALPMDIDRQNGIDMVVGSKLENASVGWLQSPANPRDMKAWTYHPLRPAGWIMSLISADINGDGCPDILFSDRRGPNQGIGWLENPGTNRIAASIWKEHHIADSSDAHHVMFIDYADVDGDGKPEVVAAYKPKDVGIFKPIGPDSWAEKWLHLSGDIGGPKAVRVADLNRDGRPDIVVSFESAVGLLTGIVWLEHTADGWAMHDLGGPDGIKYDLCPAIDLDGDGDLDVVTTEERDQLGVIWYENPTVGNSIPAPPRESSVRAKGGKVKVKKNKRAKSNAQPSSE